MAVKIFDACAQLGAGDRAGDLLESGISADVILRNMDFANVERSVVYSVTCDDYEKSNGEVAEISGKYPEKLCAFARVNPVKPGSAALTEKCFKEYGFKGLRLRPFHDGFTLKEQGVQDVFKIAGIYKAPVEIDGEKFTGDLEGLIDGFPDVPVILTHLGDFDNWVWQNTLVYIDWLKNKSNFYLCSCFEIMHFFLEQAISEAPGKVIFGSDSPTLPPAMELKRLEMMAMGSPANEKVLGGNLAGLINKSNGGRKA